MKKIYVFLFLVLCMFFNTLNAVENTQNKKQFNRIEQSLRGDFRLFLEEINIERERGFKEAEVITTRMKGILQDTKSLIEESRKELKEISYSENRNLLIASIFLWISITIFIIMNLVFAKN